MAAATVFPIFCENACQSTFSKYNDFIYALIFILITINKHFLAFNRSAMLKGWLFGFCVLFFFKIPLASYPFNIQFMSLKRLMHGAAMRFSNILNQPDYSHLRT